MLETNENVTGRKLKGAFWAANGGTAPILVINERVTRPWWAGETDPEEVCWDQSDQFVIDTAKLDEVDDFQIRYVEQILWQILYALAAKSSFCNYESSRKYSFMDTPDWWDKLRPTHDEVIVRRN